MQHVHRLAAANADVTVIAPDSPANRSALGAPGAPRHTLLSAYPRAGSRGRRMVEAAMYRVDHEIRRQLMGLPSYFIVRALMRDSPERHAILRADIVDLQWSEAIRLAPIIRRLNPGARLVGTLHDVQSQVFGRLVEAQPESIRWRRTNLWQLQRAEARAVERLDDVVVFSEKDAALLGGHPRIRIIRPPLADIAPTAPRAATNAPLAIMVSVLSRPENSEAATWLLSDVWPQVVAGNPDARLRLIGGGASDELKALAARTTGVTLAGFVDSLEPEYADAAVALVPLRRGAGVKFKTIEALVRGVPVVTTPVGAEGIGTSDLYAACSDDPSVLVEGVLAAFRDPSSAQQRANEARRWSIATFGYEQFLAETSSSYGVTGWTVPT